MSGIVASINSSKKNPNGSSLRIVKTFPVIGRKMVAFYFPESVGSVFLCLPLQDIYNSNISILENSQASGSEVAVYEVRSSKHENALVVMKTKSEAMDVVRLLSAAIAPSSRKWIYWPIAVLLLAWIALPGGNGSGVSSAPPLSIHTPMASRPSSPAVNPARPTITPTLPSSGGAGAPISADPPAPEKSTDLNDPFGLKINPVSK